MIEAAGDLSDVVLGEAFHELGGVRKGEGCCGDSQLAILVAPHRIGETLLSQQEGEVLSTADSGDLNPERARLGDVDNLLAFGVFIVVAQSELATFIVAPDIELG